MYLCQIEALQWESDEFIRANDPPISVPLPLGLERSHPPRSYDCYRIAIALGLAMSLIKCPQGVSVKVEELDGGAIWIGSYKGIERGAYPRVLINAVKKLPSTVKT